MEQVFNRFRIATVEVELFQDNLANMAERVNETSSGTLQVPRHDRQQPSTASSTETIFESETAQQLRESNAASSAPELARYYVNETREAFSDTSSTIEERYSHLIDRPGHKGLSKGVLDFRKSRVEEALENCEKLSNEEGITKSDAVRAGSELRLA